MASAATLKRIQKWVWVLIYGGLLTCITAYVAAGTDVVLARVVGSFGVLAVVVGVVLIFVRAKMTAPPPPNGKT